jgi:hypothetical protein
MLIDVMVFSISLLGIHPTFPGKEVLFFGRIEGEGNNGFVATKIVYPEVQQELIFKANLEDEDELYWHTYSHQGAPRIEELKVDYNKSEFGAKKNLVDRAIERDENLDALKIDGGPLYYHEENGEDSIFKRSSLLVQAIDIYSRLRTKSYKALQKVDNVAARNALCSMSIDLKSKYSPLDPRYDDVQKEMNDGFYVFLKSILEEEI